MNINIKLELRVYCILLVLEYVAGIQILQNIKTSWLNASTTCKNNSTRLACITPENANKFMSQPIRSAWVDTFITFSDWIHDLRCFNITVNRAISLSTELKIGTCQLACRNKKYFGLKNEKCICIENQVMNEKRINCTDPSAVHIYETVQRTTEDDGLIWDIQNNSSTLYCKKQSLTAGFLTLRNTDCKCNVNSKILICNYFSLVITITVGVHRITSAVIALLTCFSTEYGNSGDSECLNFQQFQESVNITGSVDINCRMFKVIQSDSIVGKPVISVIFNGNKVRYNAYAKSDILNADNRYFPVLSCTKVTMQSYGGRLEVRFHSVPRCDQKQLDHVICESKIQGAGVRGPCGIKDFNTSTTLKSSQTDDSNRLNAGNITAIIIVICVVVADFGI